MVSESSWKHYYSGTITNEGESKANLKTEQHRNRGNKSASCSYMPRKAASFFTWHLKGNYVGVRQLWWDQEFYSLVAPTGKALAQISTREAGSLMVLMSQHV